MTGSGNGRNGGGRETTGHGEDVEGTTAPTASPARTPGREATRPLPRRFYTAVTLGTPASGTGHAVLLDGRHARTPGRRELALPTRSLAEAVAAEWHAQAEVIDPARMPLTRLVNTALDGVAARQAEVAEDIVKYAGSDLLCYRAPHPEGLAARQRALWDPVIDWAATRHAARLAVATGLMPVAQPAEATAGIAQAIAKLDVWKLTSLHVMTTLLGSALLALAVLDRHLTPEAAWAAAHVDEDWQIAEWGEDAEAKARRAGRWQQMQAAATLAALAA